MYNEIEAILWNFPSWSIRDVRGLSVRERRHWYKISMLRAGQRRQERDKQAAIVEEAKEKQAETDLRNVSFSGGRFPNVKNPLRGR